MRNTEQSKINTSSILERPVRPQESVAIANQFDEHRGSKAIFHLMIEADNAGVIDAVRAALPKGSQLHFQYASSRIPVERDRGRVSEIKIADFTARQRDILVLVVNGLSNKEIGRRLSLSHFTVRNHIHHIMRALNLSNRKEVAAMVVAAEFLIANDRTDEVLP